MKHYFYLFRICICICLVLFLDAQSGHAQEEQSIQAHMLFSEGFISANSPDAWAMIKYGDANVNPYTGAIGLTIPIYTYQDENFTIPISFDYASTGYKPNIQSGVLGLGWYLNVGGTITREVKGIYDEEGTTSMDIYSFKDKKDGDNFHNDTGHYSPGIYGFGGLYNCEGFSFYDYRIDYGYYGKAGEEYLPFYVKPEDKLYTTCYETRPDIFHFSFPGHTGSFILQPNQEVLVFDSNHPAKEYSVEVTLKEDGFTSFIITTGDKTKYHFTKIEKAHSGSVAYSDRGITTANGWKLTKIEAPNGRTAEFTYGKSYLSYSYIPTIMEDKYDREMVCRPNGTDEDWLFSFSEQYDPTINDVEVWCLTSIKITGRAEIYFSYSDKKREIGAEGEAVPQKLDAITVYNADRNTVRQCWCYYRSDNATESDIYDLKKGGVTFLDHIVLSAEGTYSFQYSDTDLTFPPLNTYAVDWYGYYNNTVSKNNFMPTREGARSGNGYLETMRKPNYETTKYGILTAIKYPTGGTSRFEYEQNTYSNDLTKYYTSPGNRVAAGLRIAQITNYDADNTEILRRSFSYINENGTSSGQLLWRPIVYSKYQSVSSGFNQINRETLSSSSDFPYSPGTHIEYLRIIEEQSQPAKSDRKSLIEYCYNSATNTNCKDAIGYVVKVFGIGNTEDGDMEWVYKMRSTLNPSPALEVLQSRMGGKLMAQTTYSNDLDHPTETTQYEYSYYNSSSISSWDAECVGLGYGIRYHYNFGTPYIRKTIKRSYNEHGELISTTETEVELDDMRRIARTVTTDSKGGTIEQQYRYHPEVPAYLTEHIVQRNGNVIEATRYNFQSIRSFYVPYSREKGKIAPETTISDLDYYTDMTYDHYDDEGRPIQITDKTGMKTCILWGYDGMYPVAKVENIDYDMLWGTYRMAFLYPGALPADVDTELRTLDENIFVTTYAYKPLVGLTSVKSPSGHTEVYEYSDNGKLLRVKDHKRNNIKSFEYNIVTENNR